jgi:hypothetical protein
VSPSWCSKCCCHFDTDARTAVLIVDNRLMLVNENEISFLQGGAVVLPMPASWCCAIPVSFQVLRKQPKHASKQIQAPEDPIHLFLLLTTDALKELNIKVSVSIAKLVPRRPVCSYSCHFPGAISYSTILTNYFVYGKYLIHLLTRPRSLVPIAAQ